MVRPILAAAILGLAMSSAAYSQTLILVAPDSDSAMQAQPKVEPNAEPGESGSGARSTPSVAQPFSDGELAQFAGAALILQRINEDVVPKLEAASTSEEQEELAQAASVEMVQAVEGRGLTVDRFQEILLQAQTDPAVARRVVQYLQVMQQ